MLSCCQLEYLIEELRIQGFHVYQDNRTPIFGERTNEPGNPISLLQSVKEIIKHLSRNISTSYIFDTYIFGMVELIIYYKVLKVCHLIQETPYYKKENFHLKTIAIHKNCKKGFRTC